MKSVVKLSVALALCALVGTSCNCYKKMAKNRDKVSVTCAPEILTLNNDVVTTTVTVNFPAKYFNAKAVVRLTPVVVFEGGESVGTPYYFQGSKVNDNYRVVDNAAGGTISQTIEMPYSEQMDKSKLQLLVEVKCDCSSCENFALINANTGSPLSMSELELLASDPDSAEAAAIRSLCGYDIAVGVNTMQRDFNFGQMMDVMANDYKRVTTSVEKSDIQFAINSSKVNAKALKSEVMSQFEQIVTDNSSNDRAKQTITANGYASPDGPEKFNDKLSAARSESGKKAIADFCAQYGLEVDAAAYGEDWDGFKELVKASNIEDKNLILQVLSLYDSSVQREQEIKNLSAVYGELKSDVLPQLRRTQIANSIDLKGKTDKEMLALVEAGKFSELNLEETLHVSELVAPEVQVALLSDAAKRYNDARLYNNLGVAQAEVGDNKGALKSFESAVKAGGSSSELNKNLALANIANGDLDEAKKYAKGGDEATKSAMAAAEGDYTTAARGMSGYNSALANVMNENYAAAKKDIANDKSADADYLRAVIASREGDMSVAGAQLKSAVSKDSSLSKKAQSDVNLMNLFESGFKL